MDSQRSLLIIGLLAVSYLLWMEWTQDYGPQPPPAMVTGVPASTTTVAAGTDDVPVSESITADATPIFTPTASSQTISVETDKLLLTIATKGGDIISAQLKDYLTDLDDDQLVTMLNDSPATLYTAQSGLIGRDGPDASSDGRPLYQAEQGEYTLSGEQLLVPLTYVSAAGVTYVKQFIFERNSNAITVTYRISNPTDTALSLQQYAQLKHTMNAPEDGSMFMPTYAGAAYSTSDESYEKYSFSDITDDNLSKTTTAGWVAMMRHYFVSAWIPPQTEVNKLYSRALPGNLATIGYTGELKTIPPQQQLSITSTFYVGPKIQDTLATLATYLDLTVDYGFLWWLAQPLFALLSIIQNFINNWGFSIIIITIVVKGAMFWLTKAQYESMAKMRALHPKMQSLKDRYGEDRQKMSQAVMELYRKEKVNPMGGCFPLLLQMPIFMALYWVLLESVELRHADFTLWINDLSTPDPYFILPALTGLTMYLLQKLQPMTIQDPLQQKIMQWMPVAMSVFFFMFPAGLVLYWLVSNIITLMQAKIIYASMEKRGLKTS